MSQHANEPEQHALPGEEQARPPVKGQEPSEEKGVVNLYTEKDVAERHSKLRQQISQLEKQVAAGEITVKELETHRQTMEALRQMKEDEELKRATEEGPEALDIFQRLKALKDETAKSAKAKAEAEAKVAEAADVVQWRLDKAIEETAREMGLLAETIRLCGPQTLEEVARAAELVAKIKASGATVAVSSHEPDPGIGSGGTSWRDKSPEEKLRFGVEHPKKR